MVVEVGTLSLEEGEGVHTQTRAAMSGVEYLVAIDTRGVELGKGGREGDKERKREGERQTDKQTDRYTDRCTDKQTYI